MWDFKWGPDHPGVSWEQFCIASSTSYRRIKCLQAHRGLLSSGTQCCQLLGMPLSRTKWTSWRNDMPTTNIFCYKIYVCQNIIISIRFLFLSRYPCYSNWSIAFWILPGRSITRPTVSNIAYSVHRRYIAVTYPQPSHTRHLIAHREEQDSSAFCKVKLWTEFHHSCHRILPYLISIYR